MMPTCGAEATVGKGDAADTAASPPVTVLQVSAG